LLLSTPITACLVVLGRHVESLNFIELLLGDKPPLSPVQSFYQRILASDPDEVAFQAEGLLKNMSLIEYYEDVALPALALAQIDVMRGALENSRQIEVCESVERVVADLSDHVESPPEIKDAAAKPPIGAKPDPEFATNAEISQSSEGTALCLAGRSPLDQAACAILIQLLQRRNIAARSAGPQALTTSGIFGLNADGVAAICVFYLDHQGLASIRYSVRRLRKKFPNLPIAVCLWGSAELSAISEAARADQTTGSLREAINFCVQACQSPEAIESRSATRALSAAG